MNRNEQGLTLIELLAVIVILGIIAAIAVPSIGNIISNAKVDAHLANAKEILQAGKLAYANDDQPDTDWYGAKAYTLGDLIDKGYLEGKIENPTPLSFANTKDVYDLDESLVVLSKSGNKTSYKVNLSVGGSNFLFAEPLPLQEIKRKNVLEAFK